MSDNQAINMSVESVYRDRCLEFAVSRRLRVHSSESNQSLHFLLGEVSNLHRPFFESVALVEDNHQHYKSEKTDHCWYDGHLPFRIPHAL